MIRRNDRIGRDLYACGYGAYVCAWSWSRPTARGHRVTVSVNVGGWDEPRIAWDDTPANIALLADRWEREASGEGERVLTWPGGRHQTVCTAAEVRELVAAMRQKVSEARAAMAADETAQ